MVERINENGNFYFQDETNRVNYTVYFDYIIFSTVLNELELQPFIDECWYWYPYVSYIELNNIKIINSNKKQLFQIKINDILVEQLTINEEKLKQVATWIKEEKDIVATFVKIENDYVCIDGYSRLMQAYLLGFEYVYGYEEECSNFIRVCREWCKQVDVHHLKDLKNRIVSKEEHQRKWVDRCQNYLKSL